MRNVCELINGMRKMVDPGQYLQNNQTGSRESAGNNKYRHRDHDAKGILTGGLLCGAREGVEVAAMLVFHVFDEFFVF